MMYFHYESINEQTSIILIIHSYFLQDYFLFAILQQLSFTNFYLTLFESKF